MFKLILLFMAIQITSGFANAAIGAPDRVVSKIVGELGTTKYFLTSREVQINNYLGQLLMQMNGSKKVLKLVHLEDKDFPAETNEVLLEWVIYKEALDFENGLKVNDIQKEIKYVQENTKQASAWTNLEVSADEMKQILERKILVRKFMQLKSDSSKIPVSDAEAEIYFQKNKNKFGNLPFESFRENIKSFLQNTQTEQRLKNWYEVLNRKYKVRNFIAG